MTFTTPLVVNGVTKANAALFNDYGEGIESVQAMLGTGQITESQLATAVQKRLVPTGGSTGQVLVWKESGTAKWETLGGASLTGKTAGENVALGEGAGVSLAGTSRVNVAIGYNAMHTAAEGVKYNIAIGAGVGQVMVSGARNNVLVGQEAGKAITTGTGNHGYGTNALYQVKTGHDNVGIGGVALEQALGSYNVGIGTGAGTAAKNTEYIVAIGYGAMAGVVTGDSEWVSGPEANDTIGIGAYALNKLQSGKYNVAIGRNAMELLVSGSSNTSLGYYSGYENTASESTFIGCEAGKEATSGGKNTFVGYKAGEEAGAGAENVYVGKHAGKAAAGSSENTGVGVAALLQATGGKNTVLGYEAGNAITSGTGNLLLGYEAGHGLGNVSNKLAVANNASVNIIEGVMSSTAASNELKLGTTGGKLGFFGTSPHVLPEVTGSTVTTKQLAEALALVGLVKVN